MLKFVNAFYIVVLGMTIGMIFSLGVLVAPEVFHPERNIGANILTHYQSGLLMSAIFMKFCTFLNGVTLLVIVYELVMGYTRKKVVVFDIIAMVMFVGASLVFTMYLTPHVLAFQKMGALATVSEEFATLHRWSEIDFKVLLAGGILLVFGKLAKFHENCTPVCGLKK